MSTSIRTPRPPARPLPGVLAARANHWLMQFRQDPEATIRHCDQFIPGFKDELGLRLKRSTRPRAFEGAIRRVILGE